MEFSPLKPHTGKCFLILIARRFFVFWDTIHTDFRRQKNYPRIKVESLRMFVGVICLFFYFHKSTNQRDRISQAEVNQKTICFIQTRLSQMIAKSCRYILDLDHREEGQRSQGKTISMDIHKVSRLPLHHRTFIFYF